MQDTHSGSVDSHSVHKHSLAALTVGAIGVVFGDIGTSPLYAFREALHHSAPSGGIQEAVADPGGHRQIYHFPDARRQ
jgi:KUP system potassium uptake protein